MDRNELIYQLEKLGLPDEKSFRAEAFSRNIGLLSESELEKLRKSRVAIAGMGGVGGVHLITLVRLGAGCFNLADFDVFEPINVNRQYGARIPDFGRSKLEVMIEEALEINPFLKVSRFPSGLNPDNIDNFLDGADLVLDGLDFFKFEIRRQLFNRCREKGIFVITAGPLGFSTAVLVFSPFEGMSFDEYFDIRDSMSEQDKLLAFGMGLAPRGTHLKYMDTSKIDLEAKVGPSSSIACQLCSATAATEALRILLNRGRIRPVPHYLQFDPYAQKFHKGYLFLGNRNPVQRAKRFYVQRFLLNKKGGEQRIAPQLPKFEISRGTIPDEAFRFILNAGIQAPSGDNAQPWKFSRDANTIFVYLDAAADRSFFNVGQIASAISCGAVLENMRIAATALGIEGEVAGLETADNGPVGSVRLRHTGCRKDFLSDFIWERCTNRKHYSKEPIQPPTLDRLSEEARAIPGVRLHIISDPFLIKKLAMLVYRIDRIRTEHRPLHEHLHRMIRFTEFEASNRRDGLPLKNLEAGFAGEIFLKLTGPWKVMNAANKIGLGRMVALHSCQAMLASSAAALVTASGTDIQDFVRGGRALQRIWLSITQNRLAMQPMTAITLFWHRWQMEGSDSFLSSHRPLLQKAWDEYPNLFPEVDFSTESHIMLFRIGRSKPLLYRTLRKDFDSFLLE